MSDTYEKLHDATLDALRELENRNYNTDSAILYVHPVTWNDAVKDARTPFRSHGEPPSMMGCNVVENPNLPENVVMLVDVSLAARSEEAVAFGTLDD